MSISMEQMATTSEFSTNKIKLETLNKTHIALIPKVPNPEKTTHFRPISLCNNSYKILSKLLANRLKIILPSIISENQNAFVPDRQIQDNIMLAHETYHYLRLKREGGNDEFGLKLDMNKAYDRVEWDFLEAALIKFGFSRSWVNLVMSCVTTVSFSIVLNGKPGTFFKPSRGLRQGDPLSPYLFLIVSEVFSLRLTKAVSMGTIKGVKLSRGCPIISHLLFADDSLFFLKATLYNCSQLDRLFKEYCTASGQMINLDKSSLYFSPNTPSQMTRLMCELLNIKVVDNPGIYLGLPTIWGRSKKEALTYIKDRVSRKIDGWKHSLLSMAGREVLIKSVATAIPAYPMACFKFPNSICNEINSLLSNFWWGYNDGGNKIHWKNWDSLSLAKDDGGIGFRNLQDFNMALLAKQCWRLLLEPNSLWAKVLKARYFPDVDFRYATKGHRASWGWSSLVEAKDMIMKGSSWQVINGLSINIWKDNWLPPPHSGTISLGARIPPAMPVKVHSLIDWDLRAWYLDHILHLLQPRVINLILSIPIGDGHGTDRLIWPWNKNGIYSVKSGYHWLHTNRLRNSICPNHSSHTVEKKTWSLIWKLESLPKIKNFLWRVLSGAIPTLLNLYRRKCSPSPRCPICGDYDESIEHTLLLCSWVELVWFGSYLGIRINKQRITTFDMWLMELNNQITSASEKKRLLTMISFICWKIWVARCEYIYQRKPLCPQAIISSGINLANEFWQVNRPIPPTIIPMTMPSTRWTPPPPGFAKINCDASWSDPASTSGYGVMIRDNLGNVIGGSTRSGICGSAAVAEAIAILDGINAID